MLSCHRPPIILLPCKLALAMDPHSQYPSLQTPSSEQPPDPISIEALTQDLSSKAEISPVEGSETVLVTVPDAIAHLVDREASPHLASGPFSLVCLMQGSNGIAVFARVGKELQWPITNDQAVVKLDSFHYFFSVKVPPEIEEECRSASPEKRATVSSPPPLQEEILNYGITFSPTSDKACLQQVDEVLKQYSYFTAPQVTSEQENPTDATKEVIDRGKDGPATLDEASANVGLQGLPAVEEASAEYWTLLAPNVEDYSNSVARAIAAGAGQIIRGIFWCSETTIAQLEKGNLYMKGKLKLNETPTKISPSAMRGIQRVQRISAMSERIVSGVLSGVLQAAAFITRPFVSSKAGQKLLSLMPGQVALASLDGFGKIFDALEVAGKNVLTTTSIATTGLVSQRYGGEAGRLTEEGFNAVGGFLTTAWTVSKLQKVLYPSTLVKSTARVAGDERRLKENSSKGEKES